MKTRHSAVKPPRLSMAGFGFDRYSGLYIWALFIVVFSVWEPSLFPTASTVHSIASAQSIDAILTLGLLLPLSAGIFDLSIGAVVGFSTILVVILQTDLHWSMWPAIGLTVLCCIAVGVVNGFIVVKLRVNSFIATLGVATIVGAFQTIVSNNSQPLPPTSSGWNNLTQWTVLGFQVIFLYMLVIAVIIWWVLAFTPVGRYLRAIGGNMEAARLAGVSTGRWIWISLICSAGIAGVAGIFYGSLSGPSLTFGPSLLLPAFAAAFLGSTQLKPGVFNVGGSLIAIFLLATGVQGLQYVTSVQWLGDMFNGVVLIIAVAFSVSRRRSRRPLSSRPDGGKAVRAPADSLVPTTELDGNGYPGAPSANSEQPDSVGQ
jgi:ribose transport system permease protein